MVYFELLGVTPVEVVYDGIWDEKLFHKLAAELDTNKVEGLVVRIADGFKYGEFRKSVAKWVRTDHVRTTRHWRNNSAFKPNGLAKE
jgi:hypothetical protein